MTFPAFNSVAENRVRESVGLAFEDFRSGQIFHHRPGITLTQQDNIDEALATLNQAMLHYDDSYAGATEFGKPLMVSTLTLQRAIGMSWKTFGRRRRILGFESIRMIAPVFGGDTLYSRSTVLDARPSASEPDCGEVEIETSVSRADGVDVAVLRYTALIYRRGMGPLESLGYGGENNGHGAFPAYYPGLEGSLVETIGVEFDDLRVGLVIEHRPGFRFSWNEAHERSRFAGDHAPALLDPAVAAVAGGGEAAISETWLVGAFAAATTRAFGRVVANLAWEKVRFPAAAHDGDVVFAESTILDKRESRSRPDQGVVHVATRGVTRAGVEVCSYERKLLVYRSAQGPHSAAGYV
ncbi:MAG: MaoC family dehydratase [Microvirga sp.]|nr:MaoC family dehydratase [Microvirga sp.]